MICGMSVDQTAGSQAGQVIEHKPSAERRGAGCGWTLAALGVAGALLIAAVFNDTESEAIGGDPVSRDEAARRIQGVLNEVIVVSPGATLHFTDENIPDDPETKAKEGNTAIELSQQGVLLGDDNYAVLIAPFTTAEVRDDGTYEAGWVAGLLPRDLAWAAENNSISQRLLYADTTQPGVFALTQPPLTMKKYGEAPYLPIKGFTGSTISIKHQDITIGEFKINMGGAGILEIMRREELCAAATANGGVNGPLFSEDGICRIQ